MRKNLPETVTGDDILPAYFQRSSIPRFVQNRVYPLYRYYFVYGFRVGGHPGEEKITENIKIVDVRQNAWEPVKEAKSNISSLRKPKKPETLYAHPYRQGSNPKFA